jgi:L-iditol 2-dehydrogenase
VKAAVFVDINNMQIREIPKPVCSPDGIILNVKYCGICGGDVRNYHNGLKDNVKNRVMGHEFTGIVEEVGPQVKRYKVGDKIAVAPDVSCGSCYYCKRGLVNLCLSHRMLGTHWDGGFAQFCHLPGEVLERGMVHHMPEGLSLKDGAMSEPSSSVIASQANANIGLGDTVLIIGDGPIGCIHIEVARARGASKIIMVGLTRLNIVKDFNPDYLIDAAKQNPVEEVLKITNGIGADVAICANPVSSTQEQAVEAVRKRGKVILFGGVPKSNPMTTLNSNIIHYNELVVMGAFSYPAIGHEMALKMISEKKINAEKYINKIVSLDNIVEGITAAEKGEALKAVVDPWL